MAVEKSPAFQFYPADFITDSHVAAMSLDARGAYITLLCYCWREQSLPADTKQLAAMVRTTHRIFLKVWPQLQPCFLEQDGRLTQKRLDIERQKQDGFRRRQSDAGKASAAKRWGNGGLAMVQPD